MIDWDFTWMGGINFWQMVITIAVIIIAVFIVIRMLMRFWPWLRKVMALFDALGKLPKFMTDFGELKLPQFIERTDKSVARIKHEVEYNNGSSVKDAIRRVETKVDQVHTEMRDQRTTLEAEDAKLRRDLEDTKPHTPVKRRTTKLKEQ